MQARDKKWSITPKIEWSWRLYYYLYQIYEKSIRCIKAMPKRSKMPNFRSLIDENEGLVMLWASTNKVRLIIMFLKLIIILQKSKLNYSVTKFTLKKLWLLKKTGKTYHSIYFRNTCTIRLFTLHLKRDETNCYGIKTTDPQIALTFKDTRKLAEARTR